MDRTSGCRALGRYLYLAVTNVRALDFDDWKSGDLVTVDKEQIDTLIGLKTRDRMKD